MKPGEAGGGEPGAGTAAGAGVAAGTAGSATGPAPVEATRLTGPQDALPTLTAGQPPAAPDAASTLKPTVVCRLLLDADGRVVDAKIYRSRLDLAAFEDAALDAVRRYQFTPGRLAGKAVPVWINWPVAFR
jgi:TonB family protein